MVKIKTIYDFRPRRAPLTTQFFDSYSLYNFIGNMYVHNIHYDNVTTYPEGWKIVTEES